MVGGALLKCRQSGLQGLTIIWMFLFTAPVSREGLIGHFGLAFKILGKFSGWPSLAQVLSRDQAAVVMGTRGRAGTGRAGLAPTLATVCGRRGRSWDKERDEADNAQESAIRRGEFKSP